MEEASNLGDEQINELINNSCTLSCLLDSSEMCCWCFTCRETPATNDRKRPGLVAITQPGTFGFLLLCAEHEAPRQKVEKLELERRRTSPVICLAVKRIEKQRCDGPTLGLVKEPASLDL